MDIYAGLELTQRNQLILTPRMQQSLRILQAPVAELVTELRAVLENNPFLEEESATFELPLTEEGDPFPDDVPVSPWGRERLRTVNRPVAAPVRWQAELLTQFRQQVTGEKRAQIAEYLIGCLDGRGYLGLPVHSVAEGLGVGRKLVEAVRQVILRLDPPGLGALDLRECLLVQLEEAGEANPLVRRLVTHGLPALARRQYEKLADRFRATEGDVRAAAAAIRGAWPRPLRQAGATNQAAILPDLRIQEIDGHWEVFVTDELLPRLRYRPPGPDLIKRGDEEARGFVRERLLKARWLLGSIDARRRTLVGLMRIIIEEQSGFFRRGAVGLKPLGYRQIADRMGLHESTIARAVRGKYVQTHRGVVPLRFFFSKGLKSAWGNDRSPAYIRERILELIGGEQPEHPLTDEEVTQELRREGVEISRRTVAKYRDHMRIPKASFRKGA